MPKLTNQRLEWFIPDKWGHISPTDKSQHPVHRATKINWHCRQCIQPLISAAWALLGLGSVDRGQGWNVAWSQPTSITQFGQQWDHSPELCYFLHSSQAWCSNFGKQQIDNFEWGWVGKFRSFWCLLSEKSSKIHLCVTKVCAGWRKLSSREPLMCWGSFQRTNSNIYITWELVDLGCDWTRCKKLCVRNILLLVIACLDSLETASHFACTPEPYMYLFQNNLLRMEIT